jgi:hypothetical protein
LSGLGYSTEEENNHIEVALEEDLNYCLDILKITSHDEGETDTKIKKLHAQNIASFRIYHKRLITLKTIADFIALTSNTLTPSQLYDFLMLSTTAVLSTEQMITNKGSQGTTNNIIFKIYRDLMENYQTVNDILKLNYPMIIVNIVAILNNGIDMNGKQVPIYSAYDYYLSRKSEPGSHNFARVDDIYNISKLDEDKDITEYNVVNNDLVQSLVRITGRNNKEIEISLARLNNSDVGRISNLCVNYSRIEKYCRLIANDRKYFIDEIERECARKKLTKYQIQIAAISIRKVREYIENVLDRKFVPHSSHHINHTKHNLEYGYQVMGLIESKRWRRKQEMNTSKS